MKVFRRWQNRQWWCYFWCLFRQGVPDWQGPSNREVSAADCWEYDGWYQQATRAGRAQCSSAWLICDPSKTEKSQGPWHRPL